MNVIYMHTHDSGRYWSPYGYMLPTPNILAFAKDATLFRQAYCVGPTCSPSRAGLLTGMSAHENGMQGLAHLGWQLNDYSTHLASFLKSNGYFTALCGIQHEAPDYHMLGYTTILGTQNFSMGDTINSMEVFDHENTNAACQFLSTRKSDDPPFFLSMGLFNTHREYPKASADIDADYLVPPPALYDCDINRRDMADYCASVKVADDCFGQLLDTLDKASLTNDTLVIMTTDHGIAFPQMKCTLYDTGIGVGLIIRMPKTYPHVKVTDALVSQLDIFPTICELTGISAPSWLEGYSLVPLITGKTSKVRNELFAEVSYHAAYEPKRCVRTDRYKLIRRYDYHNGIVPVNIDDCTSKDFLMHNGFGSKIKAREYLFDLWLDPFERDNLVTDPSYHTVYNDLSARLEKWMLKTNDPLISHGSRIPKPNGAKIVRLEIESPRSTDYEAQDLPF